LPEECGVEGEAEVLGAVLAAAAEVAGSGVVSAAAAGTDAEGKVEAACEEAAAGGSMSRRGAPAAALGVALVLEVRFPTNTPKPRNTATSTHRTHSGGKGKSRRLICRAQSR
jgi:hypothetical protein